MDNGPIIIAQTIAVALLAWGMCAVILWGLSKVLGDGE